eukprot:05230.XXX_28095_35047_1 [CDS] Oithona nana genome sequencing.
MIRSVDLRQKEKQILDKVLGPTVYDRRIRPGSGNLTSINDKSSTSVTVNIYLRSINDIDDYKMEFSVQVTFREQWNDERLRFDNFEGCSFKYLTLTDPRKVWMPDTFFRNEKQGHFHSILVNNVYVRVFPNGDVLYSIRISLTLGCPMNLKLYPMDRQTCSIRMASYGYTTDDILYLWKDTDPVQIAQNLSLPRFSIENYASSYCNVKTNTGEYSCLSVDLIFKRQFSYYLITIYVPGSMLVIVSWVSFWLDPHAVPARVALGVTTLLTMSTQTGSINSALPPVAYTKAIDVWQGVCVTFVFSALLEYALVNYALRADRSYLMRKAALRRRMSDMTLDDDDDCGFLFGDSEAQGSSSGPSSASSAREEHNPAVSASSLLAMASTSSNNHVTHRRSYIHQQPTNLLLVTLQTRHFEGFSNICSRYGKIIDYLSNRFGGRKFRSLTHSTICFQNPMGGAESLLPSSTVTLLTSKWRKADVNGEAGANGNGNTNGTNGVNGANGVKSLDHQTPKKKKFPMEKAKRIDVISRFFFPIVFALFNMVYWSTYLLQ